MRATVTLMGLQRHHFWAHQASQDWLQHIVQHISYDEQWLEAFCMTWITFQDLLELLWLYLEWQDTGMWPHPTTDTCLALTVLKLATPSSLRYVGHLFGMGNTTTREAVLEVCSALQDGQGDTIVTRFAHYFGVCSFIRDTFLGSW
ncbi:hypothetical protein Y1Q_0000960 [Alligator mississippiensis]|uniref:Uncharacterized protein n=1 Tax=Alligator mississippiensis TaxID=8496 RepID=A0A151NE23_ALLMI|nr:hypothetical protein Y1Q_0000960 [Alligator mississippiensis]